MVNGYYLNNELTDFSFVPEKDGCPVANRVEGGKRPRSSMSPTIVYGPNGNVVLAVGAAGGSTIPAQVIKTIVGVLDFRLPPQQAVALPMIYAPGDTVFVESGTFLEPMIAQLKALGHADVRTLPPGTFKANAIELAGRPLGGRRRSAQRRRGAQRMSREARQLERFDNLVALFLTRAAEKGDKPFLWAKRDKQWQSISWAEAAARWPRLRHL